MRAKLSTMAVVALLLVSVTAFGQMTKRPDAVWARNTSAAITLDGKLNEAAWAVADSIRVQMGKSSGDPGGGWVWENGIKPATDPTDATVKFLVKGDSLYIAILCRDKSIGAGLWAHNDAILMNMRYPAATGLQGSPGRADNTQQNYECYYGWVSEGWADTTTAVVGALPAFLGWAGSPYVHPRPDSLQQIWNATTFVQGTTNSDTKADTSWTTEFVFNLKYWGYKPQQVGGDIAMWSCSIWDNDYEWPIDTLKQSSNRVFLQGPWGNASSLSHLKIFMRSDVTTASGATPSVASDFEVPTAGNWPAPVIDGMLTDGIWKNAPSISMKYGDAAIRSAYPNSLKYRSGQSQPEVNGAKNPVLDAGLATVKYVVKNDTLYLGFDVKDKFVQSIDNENRFDGFNVIFNHRKNLDGDSALARYRFAFRVDSAGATKRLFDLSKDGFDSLGTIVRVKIALKGGTTVDTVGTTADSGYTAEMAIKLTSLGYAAGRGDGLAWFSLIYYDGDSFNGGSYGTKTWLGRPGDWDDGPALFWINPSNVLAVGDGQGQQPDEFALLGNYPNPFNPSTTIKFQMAKPSEVVLDVFDVLGRLVNSQTLGMRQPGDHSVSFNAAGLASGSYFYRLKMVSTGATVLGKMLLMK